MLYRYVVKGRLNGIDCGEQLLSMQVSVKGSDFLFVLWGSALAEAWALNQHWPYTQLSNRKWTPLTKIYSDLAMLNHAAFPTDAGQNSTAHIFSLS